MGKWVKLFTVCVVSGTVVVCGIFTNFITTPKPTIFNNFKTRCCFTLGQGGNCQLFSLQQQYALLKPANSYTWGAFLEGGSGSFSNSACCGLCFEGNG